MENRTHLVRKGWKGILVSIVAGASLCGCAGQVQPGNVGAVGGFEDCIRCGEFVADVYSGFRGGAPVIWDAPGRDPAEPFSKRTTHAGQADGGGRVLQVERVDVYDFQRGGYREIRE